MFAFGQHLQQKLPQLNLAIISGSVTLMCRLDAKVSNQAQLLVWGLFHQHLSAADYRPVRLHRLHVLVVAIVVADVTRNGSHLKTTQQLDVRKKYVVRVMRYFQVEF